LIWFLELKDGNEKMWDVYKCTGKLRPTYIFNDD
jgi:hypothetical protein